MACCGADAVMSLDDDENEPGKVRHCPVLVLGFGVSAGYLAHEFAKQNAGMNKLVFVGEEPVVAYERPALSKSYLYPPGTQPPSRLPGFYAGAAQKCELQTPEWYRAHGWKTYLDHTVTKVECDKKLVTIRNNVNQSERMLSYDNVVLAMGQRAKPLANETGTSLDGVMYLRSESDAAKLVAKCERVTGRSFSMRKSAGLPAPKGRALIIGGGYLGVELLTALSGWGFEEVGVVIMGTIVLEKMTWPRVAREKLNTAIQERGSNIKIYSGCSFEKFLPSDDDASKLGYVLVDDGGDGIRMDSHVKLPCDVCIVCIGGVSCPLITQIAMDNKLNLRRDGSLVTDETFRTSHSSRRVWAIGETTLPECGVVGAREMGSSCAKVLMAVLARKSEPSLQVESLVTLQHHYSRFFEYTDQPIIWQSYGTHNVISGKKEVVGFGLTNHFDKGFGYLWFDPRSRKVIATFACCDGKNKLLDIVAEAATQGADIDDTMKKVYVVTR